MKNTGKLQTDRMERTDLEKLFRQTKNELAMLNEITHAIMQSLELDQVLYTILTALTTHDGLGFDRAMFFLVNEEANTLEGKMGLGPLSIEEVEKGWHEMSSSKFTLQNLFNAYLEFKTGPESKLNGAVKSISIPLNEESGILSMTVLEGMPFEITTEEAGSLVNPQIKDPLNLKYFVTVPLKTKNRTLGAIAVDNIFSENTITKDNIRILNMFANHAALAIENSRLYEKTVHLSRTDWLTGLWNTRYFNEMFDKALNDSKDSESCLSLLMIDIDNFKEYNDTLGHQQGDQAIKKVAHILDSSSRKSDFVCRYGGEEFCVIMSNIDKPEAKMIAERLRSKVEDSCRGNCSSSEQHKLTISLGLATFPYDGSDKEKLLENADMALYHAKQNGKNMTCQYSPGIR
ncbi:MAG: diguanylate cyclase [Candidatus Omnitrophica bacterium]|nr:diguanylate cyclase [Candidatus Omnitrophota bacterium]